MVHRHAPTSAAITALMRLAQLFQTIPIPLWRGSLLPLGCEAVANPTHRFTWQITIAGMGLLRSPAGASSLATKAPGSFMDLGNFSQKLQLQRGRSGAKVK